ncbi:type IV secretory system conjugative DNA transfer family protein [Amycolatopsis sp. cg5]|uniref:type IV secretory system conjugative DNA transfer family protein n=1 Tax=Amycolatopsis sp. cg5 TaxID=3238802 RepID=UPI0035236D95
MIELTWHEAFPPRDGAISDITGLVRVLAGRPHYGLRRLQPMVVFEVWIHADRVRWLVGIEPRIARTLPGDLTAQLPGLVLVPTATPERPTPITAREIRLTSMIHPLRLDTAAGVTVGLVRIRETMRAGEALVVSWVVGPSHTSTRVPVPETTLDWLGFTAPREPNGDEQRGWKARLAEPLYAVRGRLGSVARDPRRAAELLRPAVSALSLASGSHARVYASPQSSRTAEQLISVMGRVRSWSEIMNASEVATLMGWCLTGLEVPGGAGAFAAPPASLTRLIQSGLPQGAARPLGMTSHPAAKGAAVWLPRRSYSTHAHLIAPSGAGKSTLLAHWVTHEAEAGGSLVVIEPKGDLVEDILARLPRHRHEDVVVIDPGAAGPVIGFNPLAGPRADAERRADSILSLLREIFGAAMGPRSADVLTHGLVLASRLEDGALTDVLPILTSSHFRRSVAAKVSDPLTIAPWLAWFNNLSEAERSQVVAPVANKLRPWTARPAIRRLLGTPHPTFDLASMFTRPTILLVNLNAGAAGPETARLIGGLILSQLWLEIQRQTTKSAAARRPVSVVVVGRCRWW